MVVDLAGDRPGKLRNYTFKAEYHKGEVMIQGFQWPCEMDIMSTTDLQTSPSSSWSSIFTSEIGMVLDFHLQGRIQGSV